MTDPTALFVALAGVEPDYHGILPGAPASKARPRFGKGGRVYTPSESVAAEARTSAALRQLVRHPYDGNVSVLCYFYRPNRQRIDTDNMLKHVCDAANGVIWKDDSQVTALIGVTEMDRDNPRTEIYIGRHVSSLTRGTDSDYPCPICGRVLALSDSAAYKKKACSPECRAVLMGREYLGREIVCRACGIPFVRTARDQTMCSAACRLRSLHDGNSRGVPLSECVDCGAQLAHKRGGRCRDCWRRSISSRVREEGRFVSIDADREERL
jgi:Holliday junction resolvase RusA-like endonuclease